MEEVRLTLDEIRDLCLHALRACGLSEENAQAVAEHMTACERDACQAHGIHRLPGYCASLRSGRVNPRSTPRVQELSDSVVRVDGDNGFWPRAVMAGRPLLIERARRHGIAAMSVVNSNHFGALWWDVEPIAEAGQVALMFVNSRASVAHSGGKRRIYGTNPMAFAWPRPGRPPMVFDQASAAIARGEIEIHRREGKALKPGWAIDRDGNPTTDPEAALAGAQLTFGGHKGTAIALMVELLAAALTGGFSSLEAVAMHKPADGGPANAGQFFIAIDPTRFAPPGETSHAMERAEALFATILEEEGTRLPSERRFRARERTPAEGVLVAAPFLAELRALAGPA